MQPKGFEKKLVMPIYAKSKIPRIAVESL